MLSWSKKFIHKKIKVKVLSLIRSLKRVSFPSPFFLKAGMALEGCMVLPLFLLFMMTLLYSLEMVRFQSDVFEAMHQAGSRACFYAYESKYGNAKAASGEEISAAESVRQYLEEQLLPYLCVEGGKEGVFISVNSNHYGNGMVEIDVTYAMKPFIRWLPIGSVEIHDRFFGHGFVGYTGDGEWEEGREREIYVYITPSGSKYHFSQSCTYLKVQMKAAPSETLGTLRNASGGRYYPCEFCKPAGASLVYLTEWGNRFHGESDCPALKRTVYIIPLSNAGARTPCSKCG